ncbi:MAG TPA: DMT family transporter [Ktedonobacterales bacterium]|nr:DMT family transporter [Ktedonobacterales bacterium]
MQVPIVLLLTFAGLLHSIWNLLVKKSVDKQVFLWLALVAAMALFAVPFALLRAPIPLAGWLCVAVSGALEAVYYLLLGGAYGSGDLSAVYPLSRGSAPLFVLLFALALRNERVTGVGIAGIFLTVAGVYVLHVQTLDRQGLLAPIMALRERAARLALLSGVVIAGYSVVDKLGVRYVPPETYIYLIFGAAAVYLTPFMLTRKWAAVRKEWRINRATVVVTAVLFVASYLLVLFALRGAQVSYVAAVRGIGVVFAAVLGTTLLREPFARMKLWGSLLIFAGIACIQLAG